MGASRAYFSNASERRTFIKSARTARRWQGRHRARRGAAVIPNQLMTRVQTVHHVHTAWHARTCRALQQATGNAKLQPQHCGLYILCTGTSRSLDWAHDVTLMFISDCAPSALRSLAHASALRDASTRPAAAMLTVAREHVYASCSGTDTARPAPSYYSVA